MSNVSYKYIINRLIKYFWVCLLVGALTSAVFAFKSRQDKPLYSNYYANKVTIHEYPDDVEIPTSYTANVISSLSNSLNSTWNRAAIVDNLGSTQWEGKYTATDIKSFITVISGTDTFDFKIETDEKELTDYISGLCVDYFGGIKEYQSVPVTISTMLVESQETTNSSFMKSLAEGFIIGFFIVAFIVVVVARLNNTVKGKEDLKVNTDLLVIKSNDDNIKNYFVSESPNKRIVFIPVGLSEDVAQTVKAQHMDDNCVVVTLDKLPENKELLQDSKVVLMVEELKTNYNQLKQVHEVLGFLNTQVNQCVLFPAKHSRFEIEC